MPGIRLQSLAMSKVKITEKSKLCLHSDLFDYCPMNSLQNTNAQTPKQNDPVEAKRNHMYTL